MALWENALKIQKCGLDKNIKYAVFIRLNKLHYLTIDVCKIHENKNNKIIPDATI